MQILGRPVSSYLHIALNYFSFLCFLVIIGNSVDRAPRDSDIRVIVDTLS